MSSSKKPISSPCMSICAMNEDDVCIGCYRSQEEILDWFDYTDEQRATALKRINERINHYNAWLNK